MNSEQDAVDIFYINCWTFQMFCTCLHAFESALRIHQIFSTEDVNERVSQVEHLLHEIDEMEEDFRVLEDEYEALEMGTWLGGREFYQPVPCLYGGGIWHFLAKTVLWFAGLVRQHLELVKAAPDLATDFLYSNHRFAAIDIPLEALYSNVVLPRGVAESCASDVVRRVRTQGKNAANLLSRFQFHSDFSRVETSQRLAMLQSESVDIGAYESFKETYFKIKHELPGWDSLLSTTTVKKQGWPKHFQRYFMLWPFRSLLQTSLCEPSS